MHNKIRLLASASIISSIALTSVGAQSLFDPAPLAPQAFSTNSTPSLGSVRDNLELIEQSVISTVGEIAEAAEKSSSVLVQFSEPASEFLIQGEEASGVYSFNLDPVQAHSGGRLTIAYRNAVSVVPEFSTATVIVNERVAGSFPVRSPSGFETKNIDLPSDVLVPGRNTVRIRVSHRHRVDCSLEATYELWTELDSIETGFVAAHPTTFDNFESLYSIGKSASGQTDLRLIVPETATEADFAEAATLVQTLALYLDRKDYAVTVSNLPGTGPGIDIFPGFGAFEHQAPVGLSLRPSNDPSRAQVILNGGSPTARQTALIKAIAGPLARPLSEAISNSEHGEVTAEPQGRYTLADAGYKPEPFGGRLFRTSFDIVMPADFYPAEYATVDVLLHGATAPGLLPTSQLLFRINGKIVKSLPLRDTQGQVFEGKRIELPLRPFRPGRNEIEILAEVPRASDADCVYAERNEETPRFVLLDNTEIRIPALARLGRLPELATLTASAYPYEGDQPLSVHVPQANNETTGAALTLLARMSVAAKKPIPTKFHFSKPEPNQLGDALVVEAKTAVTSFDSGEDPYDDLTTGSTNSLLNLPAAAEYDPTELLRAFKNSAEQESTSTIGLKYLRVKAESAVEHFVGWLRFDEQAKPKTSAVKKRVLATLVQEQAPGGEGTFTRFTARDPNSLVTGIRQLVDPRVWNRVHGGQIELTDEKFGLETHAAGTRFAYALNDATPGNLRRLTAAWFSDNFQIYTLLVILLMGGFSIWLGGAVRRSGVKTEE